MNKVKIVIIVRPTQINKRNVQFCPVIIHTAIEIDACESNPCFNGATCTSVDNTYVCTCSDTYVGTNCDGKIVPSPTSISPPSNCASLSLQVLCKCSVYLLFTVCDLSPSYYLLPHSQLVLSSCFYILLWG